MGQRHQRQRRADQAGGRCVEPGRRQYLQRRHDHRARHPGAARRCVAPLRRAHRAAGGQPQRRRAAVHERHHAGHRQCGQRRQRDPAQRQHRCGDRRQLPPASRRATGGRPGGQRAHGDRHRHAGRHGACGQRHRRLRSPGWTHAAAAARRWRGDRQLRQRHQRAGAGQLAPGQPAARQQRRHHGHRPRQRDQRQPPGRARGNRAGLGGAGRIRFRSAGPQRCGAGRVCRCGGAASAGRWRQRAAGQPGQSLRQSPRVGHGGHLRQHRHEPSCAVGPGGRRAGCASPARCLAGHVGRGGTGQLRRQRRGDPRLDDGPGRGAGQSRHARFRVRRNAQLRQPRVGR